MKLAQTFVLISFVVTATASGAIDDADRIMMSIGVDSIVSQDEEALTRSMLSKGAFRGV